MKMNQRHIVFLSVIGAALVMTGCGAPAGTHEDADMDDLAALLDQPKDQPEAAEQSEQAPKEKPSRKETIEPEEPSVVTARDPKRGKVFHGQPGYLNAVFSARFVAENKLILVQIKKGMDLYEAEKGHKPKSHEEFMQKIITDGGVKLPRLEDDYEYWYDAEKGELMKRRKQE